MSRYIDAEWLKQNFNTVFWSQITKTIDSAPSIDIVRCGECKYWIDDRKVEEDMGTCGLTHYFTNADDFCSYGMRNADSNTLNTLDALDDNSSEKPNNCEELNAYRECVKSRSFWDSKHCDGCYFDERCPFDEPKDVPTISKMEQVDEPQTEREGE